MILESHSAEPMERSFNLQVSADLLMDGQSFLFWFAGIANFSHTPSVGIWDISSLYSWWLNELSSGESERIIKDISSGLSTTFLNITA